MRITMTRVPCAYCWCACKMVTMSYNVQVIMYGEWTMYDYASQVTKYYFRYRVSSSTRFQSGGVTLFELIPGA